MYDESKRRSERKAFRLKADIKFNDVIHRGFVENLSSEGLFGVLIRDEALEDLSANILVNVKFQFPTGEEFNLFCEIKRLQEATDPLVGRVYNFGMEIIDQPPAYKKFVVKL
jgi:hypothetical protein